MTETVLCSEETRRSLSLHQHGRFRKREKEDFGFGKKTCQKSRIYECWNDGILVDEEEHPYFIEMNPRIQVEHTVTEMVTGIDIVICQILIAEGYPLNSPTIHIYSQNEIKCTGYALQARVTTEDPANHFLPDTGKIDLYRSGSGGGIRLDGGTAYTGAVITPHYDSLLVKSFPMTVLLRMRFTSLCVH